MYWAMLALTASLVAGIALQLLWWLWGIYPMAAIAFLMVVAIAGVGYYSWRILQ
ncbi:hypothetical protein IQ235_00940 [Oscillatoriales cyanobacterium LEGE 11467]|uniref:Uncharacterized protein n=1 Tax=Zarconia navalis LEGE 11467 TaxID=1828826 RepID=A0A928VW69_9CYAN|nr:hypothetical protein [Zarconia navalis]MBE9039361.1 hypothetical protein [Zarconia navalis LEGE 11467]